MKRTTASTSAGATTRRPHMSDSRRIAVGVSGTGSNLRALAAAAERGGLGGQIELVFADRPCPALDWAAESGFETALVPGGDDATLEETLTAVGAEIVVLAGYMRVIGPRVLAAFGGRILNVHPSLLPAFPGAHAVADALAHGVTVTGCTVHLVDQTLDGGPILVQEAVPVLPGDDEASLAARIHAVEHRLLPWAVALLASGAVGIDGRRALVETERAEREHHRSRDGRCCPSRTRPGWSSSGGVSSATASSSCRPAGPPARCVTPACRSPTWRP